jgi:hypothetical protein
MLTSVRRLLLAAIAVGVLGTGGCLYGYGASVGVGYYEPYYYGSGSYYGYYGYSPYYYGAYAYPYRTAYPYRYAYPAHHHRYVRSYPAGRPHVVDHRGGTYHRPPATYHAPPRSHSYSRPPVRYHTRPR